jgi:cytochrome d ubiquinol oxidase subunit I
VSGLVRTSDVASRVPSSNIALTLGVYIALYVALLAAYVGVLKYMSETSDKKAHAISPVNLTDGPEQYQGRGEYA